MSKVTVIIDGREIKTEAGRKLLWTALENDIYIPHLCAVEDYKRPPASCRLCFVQAEGKDQPVTSCTLPAKDGLKVETRSPRVDRLVRTAFELLLSDHRLKCASCPANKSCGLQQIARERGLKLRYGRFPHLNREFALDESPQSFSYDPGRCVLCGQCVRADQEVAKIGAIGFARRGMDRAVTTYEGVPLADSPCTECGLCVKACPVGALYFK